MADTYWKSNELQLAKCITEGLEQQTWVGNLQTVSDLEQQDLFNAVPMFSPAYILTDEKVKEKLNILVLLASEALDITTQRCLEKDYEFLICITTEFKDCERLDDLLYLKQQIQDWICTYCCEGFEFRSFSNERLITYDPGRLTNNIFETFIPLQYSVISKRSEPEEEEGL